MYIDYNKNVTPRTSHIDYGNDEDEDFEYDETNRFGKIIRWTSIGFLCVGLLNGGLVYHNYRKSLNWSTNRDSLKMADMPVDMLNDSGEQTKYKENFLVLCNKAIGKNGELIANHDDMVKLQYALSKIKTAKPIYQHKYDKIAEKYHIRAKLRSLFKEKGQLKESSTPNKVRAILKEVDPDLNSIYQSNNHDAFAIQEVKTVHKLVNDINTITYVSAQMNNVAQIKHKRIMFIDNMVPSSYERVHHPLDKLNYKWHYLDHFDDMQDDIERVLSEQLTKINAYNDYEKDQRDKQNAYNDLAKKREAHKQANIDAIKKEQEEKEEKEKEEQEAEEEKKREEKQAAEDAKKAADDDTDDSDNSNTDKTDDSDKTTNNSSNSRSTNTNNSDNTNNSRNTQPRSNNNGSSNGTQRSDNDNSDDSTYVDPSKRNNDSEPEDILKNIGR